MCFSGVGVRDLENYAYLKGRNGGLEPATNGLYASSGVFFKNISYKE